MENWGKLNYLKDVIKKIKKLCLQWRKRIYIDKHR